MNALAQLVRRMAGAATKPLPYGFELVDSRLPAHVAPGDRCGAWLRVRNTGAMTWAPDGPDTVSLLLQRGADSAGQVVPLRVAPGECVDFHIAWKAPSEGGRHEVAVRMVHEGVAFFDEAGGGAATLTVDVAGEPARAAALYDFALAHDRSFFSPSNGVNRDRDGGTFPLFLERAQGCHAWDMEGVRYVDAVMGWGTALLGHGYPEVVEAAREFAGRSTTLTLPHPIEMEVAAMLREDIPCAEAVTFGKNGSDACTLAVRLARAHTGRRKVLTCGYHGWQDWYAAGEASRAFPPGEPLTRRFRLNDLEGFRARLAECAGDLAAVMLEPSGAAGDSPQSPSADVDPVFLRAVAQETRAAGALLIFDEIITGFRYPHGSVQRAHGVTPDLACLGKGLANGFPLSATVGRRDLFQHIEAAFYGPTHKGEVTAFAAARAALLAYRRLPVAAHVERFGRAFREQVQNASDAEELGARVVGPAFRSAVAFDARSTRELVLLHSLYAQELMRRQVLPYYGFIIPSYAHDDEALEHAAGAVVASLRVVANARRAGTLEREIAIPLVKIGP